MTPRNKILLMLGIGAASLLVFLAVIFSLINGRRQTPSVAPSPTPTQIVTSITPPVTQTTPGTTPDSGQHERELEFQEEATKVYKEYPWLNSLPIRTDTYFVYFNTKKSVIIAKLYIRPDQEQAVKTEIVTRLRALNIPIDRYPISYDINSSSQP